MYENNGFQLPIWRQNGNEGSIIGSADSENTRQNKYRCFGGTQIVEMI